jgi:hypothetical protein
VIIIRPLKIRKIESEIKDVHKIATNYGICSEYFFKKFHDTDDIVYADIAVYYYRMLRDYFDEWCSLRKKRDELSKKPFIFWE